jgi:hypothetical protein
MEENLMLMEISQYEWKKQTNLFSFGVKEIQFVSVHNSVAVHVCLFEAHVRN